MKDGNGWKVWMLGIAGVLIVSLSVLLIKILGELYQEAKHEHIRILERVKQLELKKLESKRGDR